MTIVSCAEPSGRPTPCIFQFSTEAKRVCCLISATVALPALAFEKRFASPNDGSRENGGPMSNGVTNQPEALADLTRASFLRCFANPALIHALGAAFFTPRFRGSRSIPPIGVGPCRWGRPGSPSHLSARSVAPPGWTWQLAMKNRPRAKARP